MVDEPKFTSSKFVLRPEEAFTTVNKGVDSSATAREWRVMFPLGDDRISLAFTKVTFSM